MKIKLPDGISSAQDLKSMILEVREYAKWLSHVEVKKRTGIKQHSDPPVISRVAIEVIRDFADKQLITSASLNELINGLEDQLESSPTITITLAAPPPIELKKSLSAWCRKNIKPDILVNFQFNSTLLGGMVVRYGSHVFDWSFRRQILNQRQKFPEVLRHV